MDIINTARSEEPAEYAATLNPDTAARRAEIKKKADALQAFEDEKIFEAIQILSRRLRTPGTLLTSPATVKQYLTLHLSELEHEVFMVLFLDVKNRLIHSEEMFRGTLTQTSVHPREVVKAALRHNAYSVVLAHNHPSGVPDPSTNDRLLTKALKQALALVDVRILDHIIVAGATTHSFAEHGQI